MTDITNPEASTIAELKQAGWKVLGYYCCYVPVELLTAAHVVPYRIIGNPMEQISEADSVLEIVMCPWVQNTFDQAIKGRYSFLDGIIVPHVCDAVQRIFGFWKFYLKLPYICYFDIPHTFGASSFKFFARELAVFKSSLEDFTGHKISDGELRKAIELHNENRRLVQELYSLRKPNPPLVSGNEVLQLLKTGMRLPVEEFTQLLRRAIAGAKERPVSQGKAQPRLIISGCVIDDDQLISLVEECGAHVVTDDLPIGTRSFLFQVKPGPDIMASLARTYLEEVRCPRTVVGERTKPYKEEFKDRWGYLLDYAREFGANGFILNLLHYCDAHEYDFIDLKDYLQESGFPTLTLDSDYTSGGTLRVKTRVEAFIETLMAE